MRNWYDAVLKELIPHAAPITLAADPDGLLSEEALLRHIHEKGFEVTVFEDPVAFRYAYESRFRPRLEQGEPLNLMVIVRRHAGKLDSLPYDLLQNGRKVSFSLSDLFPTFSYPAVAALDREDLEVLYKAQQVYHPGTLGENGTKDFILRHIFEIAPELIKQDKDLLRVLLRLHYSGRRIPGLLNDRFLEILKQHRVFNDWPLDSIVPHREDFFAFLQERWPLFLERMAASGKNEGAGAEKAPTLKYPGPPLLPFAHEDIRIYIDNLFNEGFLKSVSHRRGDVFKNTWAQVGVYIDPNVERCRRLEKLFQSISASVPTIDSRYKEWLLFAHRWAELNTLAAGLDDLSPRNRKPAPAELRELRDRVDDGFTAWMSRRYASLINLPPLPPVMLHHIPRWLARHLAETKRGKIALLLVDGLSLDQWFVLRRSLPISSSGIQYREYAVFAWVPTITTVCRQALFAGKPPLYFPGSIHTTEREPAHWVHFWLDQGLKKNEILYQKGVNENDLDQLAELFSSSKLRVAGLVIDKVDRIMHGMELGAAGMINQIRQWAKQGFMADLINLLLDHGYSIFLTSDHGNIEAEGCGRPREGVIADLKGERVRCYSDPLLRRRTKEAFPEAREWPTVGLPADYLCLLAPHRLAFAPPRQRLVCHGGISLEEVIVPLVKMERSNNE